MRIVEPRATLLEEKDIFKKIELAGRVCYKSEDRITDNSYEKFIKFLINRKHYSVLEHSDFSIETTENLKDLIPQQLKGHFVFFGDMVHANVRAWREFLEITQIKEIVEEYPLLFGDIKGVDWGKPFRPRKKEWDEEVENPFIQRDTFVFQTSRDISHQLVRHRVFSISQESQRYCNYSLGKFGSGIKYIMPEFIKNGDKDLQDFWLKSREKEEDEYFKYLEMEKIKPENARNCLSNATATTIVITSSLWGWKHFLDLRLKSDAQSEIRYLAESVYDQLLSKYKGKIFEGLIKGVR